MPSLQKTVVINAVGLTPSLIGPHTPRLNALADAGAVAPIGHVLPAVTTTVQSTYLTGKWPAEHGAVANGWYFRDECEVKFWKQSNRLVQSPKIWDIAKATHPGFTCANCFWWYAMYSRADYTVTPRPMYPADGRKLPDIWTNPPTLRDELQRELGQFPLFNFWGPATSIKATDWIAESAIRVDRKYDPTLTLVYLPHLDYVLQKVGPDQAIAAKDLRELDDVCGKLFDHFEKRSAKVIVLSEYGIEAVNKPIDINRVLRRAGLIAVRKEMGRELLDPGQSVAFAAADHQVAHVYVNDRSRVAEVKALLEDVDGIESVLDADGKRAHHVDHDRSGELVAVAERGAWFTYYYWLDDAREPDFARSVDIHRKPGYDPAELFLDPKVSMVKGRIALTLLRKKLGFRTMMKVIPTDATLVKGSHGRPPATPAEGPMFISRDKDLVPPGEIAPTAVRDLILRHVGINI
ncbi:alkaline phosphatase family protein [Humisphaera borealis]|uniref:Alkaline phosphatase family protein n=1 Tax=Humisphaera borealis TaxID=2807512 RepID=A0A7M2WQ15_9BACT|nr:nucleotide pyrophosphatase/phosphodiesterase family protein [Humisphaera borealis]QOV87546.1 alkaline phosphatase family protein [Humisphaera borealis]